MGNEADPVHNELPSPERGPYMLRLFLFVHSILQREEGQDLVEYALVVALIAFGAIAGMQTLATSINSAFSTISSDLNSALI
jgi:pilus assembly protein Flp/PilA